MTRFRGISGVARQVGLALLASVVIFIVTRALPRTPMQVYLETHGQPVTPEALEALSRRWGLDGPLTGQYLRWITGFLTCVPDEMDSPQSPVRKPVIHRRY